MTRTTVKIVFSAHVEGVSFEKQIISLGGNFPEVEIEKSDETWLFKIEKGVPHASDGIMDSVVAEASAQIERFWNLLEYIVPTRVYPCAEIYYELSGRILPASPRPQSIFFGQCSLDIVLTENYFNTNRDSFNRSFDYDLLKRFNFAKRQKDKVNKFLSLYSLLASVAPSDLQVDIDRLIENVEPTVSRSASPRGAPETIFTRLRNELAHHREGSSVFATHAEIEIHLERFEWIVKSVIDRLIVS